MQPPALNSSFCHGDKIRLTLMQLICWCICNKAQANESRLSKAAGYLCERLRFRNTPGLVSTVRVQFWTVRMCQPHCHRLSCFYSPIHYSSLCIVPIWVCLSHDPGSPDAMVHIIHDVHFTHLSRTEPTDKWLDQFTVCCILIKWIILLHHYS